MITVNGESRTLEKSVTVTEYLEACNYVPVQVVVELNEEIIKRDTYDTTVLKDGARASRKRRQFFWNPITASDLRFRQKM